MTTVSAGAQRSPVSASQPSASSAAPAAPADDDDDEIEVLKEQSLDEVLEVRALFDGTSMLKECLTHQSLMVGPCLGSSTYMHNSDFCSIVVERMLETTLCEHARGLRSILKVLTRTGIALLDKEGYQDCRLFIALGFAGETLESGANWADD